MRLAEGYGNADRQGSCFVMVASASLLAQRPMTDERMALLERVKKQTVGDLVREMLAFAVEERRSCLPLPLADTAPDSRGRLHHVWLAPVLRARTAAAIMRSDEVGCGRRFDLSLLWRITEGLSDRN
ncbi:hypothetical protein [Limimaricola cinnabarinus]|nr:hypothetical protein [Limimaricola cinnabarinus]